MTPSRRLTVNRGMNSQLCIVNQDWGSLTMLRCITGGCEDQNRDVLCKLKKAEDFKHLISLYSEKQFWRQC